MVQAQVAQIIKICESASAFYFSSANLIFYIKNGAIYITKQGKKFVSDIIALFDISASDIKYDSALDNVYTITRTQKESAPALSIEDLRALLK
jgi:hypothetical protein